MKDGSVVAAAFSEALNRVKEGWRVSGEEILGPDNAIVRFVDLHGGGPGHVDVQFIWGEGTEERTVIWDCVSGFGKTSADLARTAAHIWCSTTAGAICELFYSRRGEFADHYSGQTDGGIPDWRVIAGAVIGYGSSVESSERLQQWLLNCPVPPSIGEIFRDTLDVKTCPHGIKILLGGESVAEVRVDGEFHESASSALLAMDWPRLTPSSFVRTYVIAVHRE